MASKIISYWIDNLEETQATKPAAFKKNFPNTTCTVDCSASLLQIPKKLDSIGESYSHYYSHNTEIPGSCSIFAAYGGQCSDKFKPWTIGLTNAYR